jgi:hypothetical protein
MPGHAYCRRRTWWQEGGCPYATVEIDGEWVKGKQIAPGSRVFRVPDHSDLTLRDDFDLFFDPTRA